MIWGWAARGKVSKLENKGISSQKATAINLWKAIGLPMWLLEPFLGMRRVCAEHRKEHQPTLGFSSGGPRPHDFDECFSFSDFQLLDLMNVSAFLISNSQI